MMSGFRVLLIAFGWYSLSLGCCNASIQFTSQPSDIIARHNSPLTINCTASTTLAGNLRILWRRNGTWIADYINKHFRQLSNGSLHFERFLPADQGFYQCSALVQDSNHIHLGQIYSRNATIKLAYIHDKFILNPESKAGLLGSNIQLQCLTPKSEPIANMYWEKDGRVLHGYENGTLVLTAESILSVTLVIKNISKTDVGSYRCVAYNQLIPGRFIYSNSASLNIAAKQEQPYFEKQPSSVIASRSQPFTWECIVRGIPQPSIRWYRNSVLVGNDTNRFMLSTGSLHFVSVREEYNGTYTCEGRNPLGVLSSYPPVAFVVAFIDHAFTRDPTSKIVNAGQPLVLHCSPPRRYPTDVTIIWYKDYIAIPSSAGVVISTDGSLHVNSVTRSNGGVYFCVAENPITREKRSSRQATVTVRVASVIQSTFGNTSGIVGQYLSINCLASGSPTPAVKWYKGGVAVTQNGTLVFAKMSISDAGIYVCQASNPAGNATRQLQLHVYTMPTMVRAPSNKTKTVGESTEFICEVVGFPMPVVTWYFIGRQSSSRRQIVLGNRFIKTSNGLQILSIQKSDEGRYICIANSTGGRLEASALLTVNVPPTFTHTPTNQTSPQSSRVSFHCAGSGDPLPTVSWYFNGTLLTNGPRYSILSGSLTIQRVVKTDSGWFTCRLSNAVGMRESRAYLDVQVPPAIVEFSVPATARIGSNFTVRCNANGNPKPSLKWRRNATRDLVVDGIRITGNENSIMVASAGPNDSGLYQCIATNSLGVARRNASLVVQVLPHPPEALAAKSYKSTSITVTWTPGFDGYSSILRYILEISRSNSVIWTQYSNNIAQSLRNYTVSGLQPYTMYMFKMKSVTAVGASSYSSVAEARTLEDAPSVPLNVMAQVFNATTVILRWSKPDTTHGIITLYQLLYGKLDTSTRLVRNITAHQQPTYKVIINDLKPFSRYYFRLRAATGIADDVKWGNMSGLVYANTPESAPSAAPRVTSVTALSSTSISVAFSELPVDDMNGILTAYKVTLTAVNQKAQYTNDTKIHFIGLSKYTTYNVRVRACTRVACGPESAVRSVTTLEDAPSEVRSPTAVVFDGNNVNISWKEPLRPNGILTHYKVFLSKQSSNNNTESVTVPGNTLSVIKRNLSSNSTYLIWITASTSAGMGPKSTILTVKIDAVTIITTRNPTSSPTSTQKPTVMSSTSPTKGITTTVTKAGVGGSVDWLNKQNLPILIGVVVTIVILLIAVIILMTMTVVRRWVRGADKRERWISTRTQSAADNPAYNENRDLELTRTATMKSPEMTGPAPNRVEIPVAAGVEAVEDFVFEDESDFQAEDSNPSNAYAGDETIRAKGKDDKSPLIKLRNNVIDLGDDASDYDSPYTQLGELGEPFSKDLFAFIDDEEKKSLSEKSSSQGSLADKEELQSDGGSISANGNTPGNEQGVKSENLNSNTVENEGRNLQQPATDPRQGAESIASTTRDLTWDPYDTSSAVVHDREDNEYDEPDTGTADTTPVEELYAKVNKKRKDRTNDEYDDRNKLIEDESAFIYNDKTTL